MADDSALSIQLDGKTYRIEDFELGELEWLEDELGCALEDADLRKIGVAVRFVYLLKRRDDPEFTLDDARKLRLNVFDAPDADSDTGKAKRPTRAAAKASG